MKCFKIEYYDKDGNPVRKPKKSFDTLDCAIKYAKKINVKESTIHKVVAYKCPYCYKYHIGKSKKEITQKEKDRYNKHLRSNL
jgi:hypothetical protein